MNLPYATFVTGFGALFTIVHVCYLQNKPSMSKELLEKICLEKNQPSPKDNQFEKEKPNSSHNFDIWKEPLHTAKYTQCLASEPAGGEFHFSEFKEKVFSGNLDVTDNRSMETMSREEDAVLKTSFERGVSVMDDDFFEKVVSDSVAHHLFDVGDEAELEATLSYFVLRPRIVNTYVPKFLLGHDYPTCAEVSRERSGSTEPHGDAFPFLLILAFSQIHQTHLRETIRRTWGQASTDWFQRVPKRHQTVRLMFILGYNEGVSSARLAREAAVHQDIVQADFVDSYPNLTLKTASALYWARNYCHGVAHVMKVDSDTFVNTPELVRLLTRILPDKAGTNTGHRWILGNAQPSLLVEREGRWMVDLDVYPMETFPTYLFGHSYVISGCVIEDLLRAYHRMPLVPVEDVFFTGILAKAMGIRRIISPSFADRTRHVQYDLTDVHAQLTSTFFDFWEDIIKYYSTLIASYIYQTPRSICPEKCF